ncbi:MAG TPA: amidohydrolase family protein [Nannocystaceae bacterium]|nr:amidohydrolase family protein [Nannocystaceae bacterium]
MSPRPFDADGHVLEDEQEIHRYIVADDVTPEEWPALRLFPTMDGWHRGFLTNAAEPHKMAKLAASGDGRGPSVQTWRAMLDAIDAEGAVLFPTIGLSIGLIQDRAWAALVAGAYNRWVDATYARRDDRIYAAGLLPVQDPLAAAREIARCRAASPRIRVMCLPSVVKSGKSYGHRDYWPIYAAAQAHDMPLAVHGSPSWGFGLDHLDEFVKVHTLSHPIPIFVQLTDLLFSGVFDEFPRLKIAFLEAGCGWVPWLLDRLDYELRSIFGGAVRRRLKRTPLEVMRDSDQFWVSAETGESGIKACVDAIGAQHVLYASDFPHEPTTAAILREVGELAGREDLTRDAREHILARNARRFLGLS